MEVNYLVSICIPTFNAEKYIEFTLKALLHQTYSNLEVIVVDDNSSDNTRGVIDSFCNDRVKVIVNSGKGASSARNLAFKHSSGSFVVFFDADDYVPQNFIETQLKTALRKDGSVAISAWGRFTGFDLFSFKHDPFIVQSDLSFYDWIIKYWTFCRHTTPPGRVLIPRNVVEQSGLWNEALSLNDDFEFFTRIFSSSSDISYNKESIFYYRSGIGGLSSKKTPDAYRSYFLSLKLSFDHVLKQYQYDSKIAFACANMWKMFIYESYPIRKDLIKLAEQEIIKLGGADIAFPAGGKTKLLSQIVGWKVAKRISNLI